MYSDISEKHGKEYLLSEKLMTGRQLIQPITKGTQQWHKIDRIKRFILTKSNDVLGALVTEEVFYRH